MSKKLFCESCQRQFYSQNSFDGHLTGKKHQGKQITFDEIQVQKTKQQIEIDYMRCGRKHRFKFLEDAQKYADNLLKENPSSQPMKLYRCKVCNGWHIGHPSDPQRPKIIKIGDLTKRL